MLGQRNGEDSVGLPLVGSGLREAEMGEDAVDELLSHFGGALGVIVEGGNCGKYGGTRI